MSHSHTVIDLSSGLTVLTGPNNCGKSAFVSALQILAENSSGDYMVRHGAKECRIIVETDDGHTIEWKRKKKTVSYCIDGEEFHRLRNSVPEKLQQILKLSRVKAGDSDEFDVHFGEQKSPIFLLGEPGSRAARFFASSSDASKLIEMQKLHRNKVKSAQQEFQWQQTEEKQNAAILELLKPVPDLESRLEDLNQTYQVLSVEQQQIQQLEMFIQELAQVKAKVDRDSRLYACLNELPTSLEQVDAKPLAALVQRWQEVEQERQQSQVTTNALNLLQEPPTLQNEVALGSLIRDMGFQYRVCQRSEETQNCLESLYAPPQLTNPDNLEKLIVRLAAAEERTLLDQEAAAILMECVPPPELIDGDRLAQLCQQWETAVALFQELQQIQAESESEYERVRTELIHWVEENPSCPTCGAELEPGQFILIAETGLKGHIHGT